MLWERYDAVTGPLELSINFERKFIENSKQNNTFTNIQNNTVMVFISMAQSIRCQVTAPHNDFDGGLFE